MHCYRAILYLIYRKRKFKKLIVPTTFFFVELLIALILSVSLLKGGYLNTPLYAYQPVEKSQTKILRYDKPQKDVQDSLPLQSMLDKITEVSSKLVFYAISLLFSFIGMLLAHLWISRFFRNNNLNIRWWLWPMACLGSHIVLYTMANF
ncbi:MAG: hypothetical protein ACK4ND_05355 [Cytophagaceae bacterium]